MSVTKSLTHTVGDLDFSIVGDTIVVSHHGFPLITRVVDKVNVAELYQEVEDMLHEAATPYIHEYYTKRLIEL